MTIISKSHKRFSEFLINSRVFTNPEEFLGPNYEAVLNFWLFLDELTKEQLETIECRYWNFYNNQLSEWRKVAIEAHDASEKTIGRNFTHKAAFAAEGVYGYTANFATRELIGMHKLFERNHPLTFFALFLDL